MINVNQLLVSLINFQYLFYTQYKQSVIGLLVLTIYYTFL